MSDEQRPRSSHARRPLSGPAPTRRTRVRWGRVVGIASMALVVVLVVSVGGTYLYARFRYSQVKKVSIPHLTQQVSSLSPMTILLIGNNSRQVLSSSNGCVFGCKSAIGGARSDVTMLAHLDPATGSVSLLSIPRDLFLPVPGTNHQQRVDDALNVGPQALVDTIQQDLGIPINHFVELNFDTFQAVVNSLGGVNMYFPNPVKDSYSLLNVPTAGCHHLNGFQALAVVRSRHLYYYANGSWQYDGLGDLSRIRRDHEFLKVLAKQVLSQGLSNPITANTVLSDMVHNVTVDSGFGFSTMLSLVQKFRSVHVSTIPTYTLPIVYANNYVYQGANYGDVVLPAQPLDQQVVAKFLGETLPAKPSSTTPVSVIDASGNPSGTAHVASLLRQAGWQVSGISAMPTQAALTESVVYYHPGQLALGQRLADELSGTVALGANSSVPVGSLTLQAGNAVSLWAPPAKFATALSTVAPTLSSSKPSPTPSTSTSSPGASARPSPSTSPTVSPHLPSQMPGVVFTSKNPAPWDPVACVPGAPATPLTFGP
ncbi:MAG: LCP family protein [Actinomycetes bacterium]